MATVTEIKKTNIMQQSATSLLSLLHMASPALPVGAFAYSQGLEYALDKGWCKTRDDVHGWIESNLEFGLGQLDLPIYIRIYQAWKNQNTDSIQHWNDTLLAFRESKELYLEDIQVGSAYVQWHLGQDANRADTMDCINLPTVVTMNAYAAIVSEIEIEQALIGFVWSWVENQITTASKAMPMGQTDGQRILKNLIPKMAAVCERAFTVSDEEIGTGLMGTAMASSLHEQQYSRLFRS